MRINDEIVKEKIMTEIVNDDRILAAYMNGSRCSALVTKDYLQDFDLVYVVKEPSAFYKEHNYMATYGTIAYYQCPEAMDFALGKLVCLDDNYGWLVQYKEGHRIDLHVQSLDYAIKHILEDSNCILLVDKGNYLPKLPDASEKSFYVQCPSETEFIASCNEFWWCLNNVAKGLARKDLIMVLEMHHNYLRKELLKMLSYEAAYPHDFKINIGKFGNRLYKYIDAKTYESYLSTFAAANKEDLVDATKVMINLFDQTSHKVADLLGYTYNHQEATASSNHLYKLIDREQNYLKDIGESW